MQTVKVNELSGAALDWAVATLTSTDGRKVELGGGWNGAYFINRENYPGAGGFHRFSPSEDWSQGGPIIEREGIEVRRGNPLYFPKGNEHGNYYEPLWIAGKQHGQTPLIAAMRYYVVSKLGDETEIPEELL